MGLLAAKKPILAILDQESEIADRINNVRRVFDVPLSQM